jgi:hypothetical protein
MGELADRLGRIVTYASSPDGRIHLDLRGSADLRVSFDPGSYRSYSEERLGHQLSQLGALAWVHYHRAYVEVIDEFLVDPVRVTSTEDAAYRDRVEQLSVRGRSPEGALAITSRALLRWDVTVAPGAIGEFTEREFLAELHAAVGDLLADHRARTALLRAEVYGLGLPTRLQEAITSAALASATRR